MRLSKAEKALEKSFEDAFRVQGTGIQFNVMNLGPMKRDTLAGVASGKSMAESLAEAIAKYREDRGVSAPKRLHSAFGIAKPSEVIEEIPAVSRDK